MTAVADRDRLIGKIERGLLDGGAIPFSARLSGNTLNLDGGRELRMSMQRVAQSALVAAIQEIDSEAFRRRQVASVQEANAQAQRKLSATASAVDQLRKLLRT